MSRILIVEDSPTQAEQLRLVLEAEEFEVEVAADAELALSAFEAADFDLIISDIVMPGLSGYELCQAIKRTGKGQEVPVVLLSTLNDPLDIIQGLECGADNFLTKPWNSEQLISRVKTVLSNRQIRALGKFRVGVEVMFLGKKFAISSDKEQILDLLMSTFEDIVRTNRDLEENKAQLVAAKSELEQYAQKLEQRVEERTATLRSRQRQLSDAQRIAQLGDWRWPRNGDVECSEQMLRIFGLNGHNPSQDSAKLMSMVCAEDLCNLESLVNRCWAERQSYRTEFRISLDNGEVRHCWVEGHPDIDDRGETVGLIGVCQDITERKLTEIASREAAERYSRLVEYMPDGILVIANGHISFANEAALAILRASDLNQLIGRPALDLVHPDCVEVAKERIAKLRGGANRNPVIEQKFLRLDGSPVSVEVTSSAMTLDGEPAIHLVVRDLTERKAVEEKLYQAQKMEAIGQLTGGIAHDFNNLLAVMIGNLDDLKERLPVEQQTAEAIQECLQAALSGADLTNRLLAFARRQTLQPKLVDVNEIVSASTKLLRRVLGEHIELHVSTVSKAGEILVDRAQLEAAITNLAVNARDAMPSGGKLSVGSYDLEIGTNSVAEHEDIPTGDYVIIEVADTGAGIERESLKRVFEPFFTTKEIGKGTGLGLSMVLGFMQQSGGYVRIHSDVGIGTTVRLYVPRPVQTHRKDCSTAEAPAPAHTGTGEVVLAVEDNEGLRRILVKQLRQLGYEVIEADAGHAALSILRTPARIDLLLTDIVMPGGVDGHELAREAAKARPNLKVLFTSGFPEAGSKTTAQLGPDECFLAKPYRQHELARKLREVLAA